MERGRIVVDQQDREAFVARLGAVATAIGITIYAWALLPHHAHLLLRSGPQGLPRVVRRCLTGYARTCNRWHHRVGPLVPNRDKSIVVEAEASFSELVRSFHLNPLRAKLIPDLRALDRYPWRGHRGLLTRATPPWHDRRAVLAWFGRTERASRTRPATRVRQSAAGGPQSTTTMERGSSPTGRGTLGSE
jgi:hypothetical protein